MNYPFITSCAITGTFSFLFGIFVYLRNRSSNVNRIWMMLNFCVSLWSWSLFARELAYEKTVALFFVRLCYVGTIFLPPLFLHFVNSFLKFPKNRLVVALYTVSFTFMFFDFTPLLIKDVRPILSFRHYGIPGPLYPLYTLFLIGIVGYSHYILIKYFKKSEGETRNQIKYLLFATVIGFFGGATTFLPVFEVEIFPFGFYLVSIYVVITSYAIAKHRLMDINIVFKKGTTYVLLLLLLFVPSFLFILLSQKIFFYKISYLFSAVIVGLLFLITVFFYRIKLQAEKMVEQVLFKNRYDYRETLADFSKAMVSILDLQSLSRRIFETITETMQVEKASLFLWNEEKVGYSLFESKNVGATAPTPLIPKDDSLPCYLQKMGRIIIREELAKGVNNPPLKDIATKMSLLEAEVSIPFISKGQLVAMMNLGYKFTRDIYSHEDIELLSTLANQMAIAIENARLYEDLKRSKSYIRRADRLASLGTLTAGLAHEIRNPLVAIKTLTQLLPERLEDEEFRDQFLKIASGEVDRISSLVNELLDFARPSDPKWALEDINAILDGMILLVSTGTKKKLITIVKNYALNLPLVQIDREQIKQVVLNILLNAIDATAENGTITVQTRSFIKPGGEPYIQIEFTDTGCGIPGEHLEDIFNPFFTTKATGSGLGLSISNQIIQDHKGYIDVESEIEKGSSFFINLPVHQNYPKRRIRDSQNNKGAPTPLEER